MSDSPESPLPAAVRLLAAALIATVTGGASAEEPVFKDPFTGETVELPLKAGETETPALAQFKQTGENPYRGQPDAIAAGKKLYDQWCQVCHNADASGKMGPPLIGNDHIYPQTSTDAGMFAIINLGASGAMQSFAGRITQDDMLKIIAWVRSLDK